MNHMQYHVLYDTLAWENNFLVSKTFLSFHQQVLHILLHANQIDFSWFNNIFIKVISNDIFVFEPSGGNDIIAKFQLNISNLSESKPVGKDFEVGKDKINLQAFNYNEFSDVKLKLENNSEGVVVFNDQATSFMIFGVSVEDLSINDFILL